MVDSMKVALTVGGTCSSIATLACIFFVINIKSRMESFSKEMLNDQVEFQHLADAAWHQIHQTKAKLLSNGKHSEPTVVISTFQPLFPRQSSAQKRHKRQSVVIRDGRVVRVIGADGRFARRGPDPQFAAALRAHRRPPPQLQPPVPEEELEVEEVEGEEGEPLPPNCRCASRNPCPPGPAGSPGLPGRPGVPGLSGEAGLPGYAGALPPAPYSFTKFNVPCIVCPPGGRGEDGQPGIVGFQGLNGEGGADGEKGYPGTKGARGLPGPQGVAGPPGEDGEKGDRGRAATQGGKGEPGEDGENGQPGANGPPGQYGKDGNPGDDGGNGRVGDPGQPGGAGIPGLPGTGGEAGEKGSDAGYCQLCETPAEQPVPGAGDPRQEYKQTRRAQGQRQIGIGPRRLDDGKSVDEHGEDENAQSSGGVSALIQRWFQRTAPHEAPAPVAAPAATPPGAECALKIDVNTCAELEASQRQSSSECTPVGAAAAGGDLTQAGGRFSRQLSVSLDDVSPRPSPSPSAVDRPPLRGDRQSLQRRESVRAYIRKVSTTTAVSSITSKLFADKRGLLDYDRSEFRSYWMPDARGKECYECQDKFTAFRRRHHCRICGQIFCSKCCNQQIPGHFLGYVGDLRLCGHCARAVVQFLDLGEDCARDVDGQTDEGPPTAEGDPVRAAPSHAPSAERLLTGATEPQPAAGPHSQSTGGGPARSLPTISASLEPSWNSTAVDTRDYFDYAHTGFERDLFQNGRYGAGGGADVALLNPGALMGAQSGGAAVPGVLFRQPSQLAQGRPSAALLDDTEPDWLKGIDSKDNDDMELNGAQGAAQPASRHISGHARSSSTATASTSDSPSRHASRAAQLGSTPAPGSTATEASDPPLRVGGAKRKQSTLPVFPLLRPQLSTVEPLGKQQPAADTSADAHCDQTDLSSDSDASSEAGSRCSAADGHGIYRIFESEAIRLLKYLLQKEGLCVQHWLPAIWPLVQEIAFTVTPSVRERRDSMDVLSYVHVKTLCTGDEAEPRAQVVFGTACTKTLADRRMCTAFLSPSILLVGGSVEYERSPAAKLTAIEPVIRQETDYLRNMVLRIVSVKPQLVCVEGTVARVAAQLLRDAGVTLMCHLKPAVMRRVARCTQAHIVPSIDSQLVRPTLGQCGRFAWREVALLGGKVKRLAVFDECDPDLSCAVLLYANSRRQLRCAKRVLRFMTSVVYSARLETELLSLYRVCLAPHEHAPQGALTKNTDSELDERSEGVDARGKSLRLLLVSDCKICSAGQPLEVDSQWTVAGDTGAAVTPGSDAGTGLAAAAAEAVLTVSALIAYRLPFAERQPQPAVQRLQGASARPLLAYFKQPLYRFARLGDASKRADGACDGSCTAQSSPHKTPPSLDAAAAAKGSATNLLHQFVSEQLTRPLADPATRGRLATYRAAAGRVFKRRVATAGRGAGQRRRSLQPSGDSVGGRDASATASGQGGESPPFGAPVTKRRSGARTEGFARAHWRHSSLDEFAAASRQCGDVLSPYCHQRLAVLFASYSPRSPNAPQLCVRPWVVWMEFYGRHDMALGEFLRRYCFNAAYKCPSKGCDVSMLHHARKIVHGRSCVEIVSQSVVELDCGAAPTAVDRDDTIIAWDWCTRCRVTSSGRPLSDFVWQLSFAKYLEYLCNGRHALSHMTPRDADNADSPDANGNSESPGSVCAHCLFHQHEHYFALDNHVTCFKVRPINVYEISFAPIVARVQAQLVPVLQLVDEMKSISESLGSVCAAMSEQIEAAMQRLGGAPADGVLASRQRELAAELRATADTVHEALRTRLAHTQEWLTLLKPVSTNKVPASDATYLKIKDTLTRCRQLLVLSLLQWNRLSSEYNALSKGAASNQLAPGGNGSAMAADVKRKSMHNVLNGACEMDGLQRDGSAASLEGSPAAGRRLSVPSTALASLAVCELPAGSPITERPAVDGSAADSSRSKPTGDTKRPGDAAVANASAADLKATTATPTKDHGGGTVSQLAYPFDPLHHYALPLGRLPVIVKERDVGSIIAYTLASHDYENQRVAARDACGMEGVPTSLKAHGQPQRQHAQSSADLLSAARLNQQPARPPSSTSSGGIKKQNSSAVLCDTSADSCGSDASGAVVENPPSASSTGDRQHVEVQFGDAAARYYCKVYYAEHFRLLRKLLFADGEDAFVRSLSCTDQWHPKGGKSGASFHRSVDGRFVLKQLSRFEMQSFLKFAPDYFHYLSTAATEGKLTTLAKIFGVYRIGYRNHVSNSAAKMDLLVMEHLFYQKNVTKVYDLKGSLRNRMASEKTAAASDLVLLDENFLKELWHSQFYVHAHAKAALNAAICADAHFLAANGVMDYSLLVGTDEHNQQLVVGIVDYMRTYTLDKKVESWVKIVAVPGAHLPTILSPELYCGRFAEAIDTYFAVSPDQWAGLAHGIPY